MANIIRSTVTRILLVWLVGFFTLGLVWRFIVNRI
jgi:hypothetical protein